MSEATPSTLKPCGNPACERLIQKGTYCSRCSKRLQRHGDPNYVTPTKKYFACDVPSCEYEYTQGAGRYCFAHARRHRLYGDPLLIAKTALPALSIHKCANPVCAGLTKRFELCEVCRRFLRRGQSINPKTRKYPRLCLISWCPKRSVCGGLCDTHREYKLIRGLYRSPWGNVLQTPRTCLSLNCDFPCVARGLCLVCLQKAATHNLLYKEYLPNVMGHRIKHCIGKPDCKRREALFGRCPDCLYDWQLTTSSRRNFFKNLRWPKVSLF